MTDRLTEWRKMWTDRRGYPVNEANLAIRGTGGEMKYPAIPYMEPYVLRLYILNPLKKVD